MAKVRDIIKPQMTVAKFLYKGLEEGYFQRVCQKASAIAYGFEDMGYYHPYSWGFFKQTMRGWYEKKIFQTKRQEYP